MRQGIDITDVEAATKIRAKYLRALENEEFDMLQGGTFVRSFLRTYAQFLGLDAHRLLEEYRSRYEPREEVELQPIAPRPQRQREPRSGRSAPPPRRGAIVVLAAVGLLIFLLVLGLTGDDDGSGDDDARQASTQETQPREREQEPEPEPEEQPAREDREERPERVRVRVTPSTPIYICWDRGPDSESTELSGLSEARTFRGRRIRLNIGNPSATVTVDGDRLDLEGTGPFGFDIRPGRDPRPIPSGERPCQ